MEIYVEFCADCLALIRKVDRNMEERFSEFHDDREIFRTHIPLEIFEEIERLSNNLHLWITSVILLYAAAGIVELEHVVKGKRARKCTPEDIAELVAEKVRKKSYKATWFLEAIDVIEFSGSGWIDEARLQRLEAAAKWLKKVVAKEQRIVLIEEARKMAERGRPLTLKNHTYAIVPIDELLLHIKSTIERILEANGLWDEKWTVKVIPNKKHPLRGGISGIFSVQRNGIEISRGVFRAYLTAAGVSEPPEQKEMVHVSNVWIDLSHHDLRGLLYAVTTSLDEKERSRILAELL